MIVMKNVNGTDECFACGYILDWGNVPSQNAASGILVQKLPDVIAEITAVGKEGGKLKIEALCTCPRCRMKNKYVKIV